jgi:hypothetical protein
MKVDMLCFPPKIVCDLSDRHIIPSLLRFVKGFLKIFQRIFDYFDLDIKMLVNPPKITRFCVKTALVAHTFLLLGNIRRIP